MHDEHFIMCLLREQDLRNVLEPQIPRSSFRIFKDKHVSTCEINVCILIFFSFYVAVIPVSPCQIDDRDEADI
jgi:hypothetical protein